MHDRNVSSDKTIDNKIFKKMRTQLLEEYVIFRLLKYFSDKTLSVYLPGDSGSKINVFK